MVEGSSKGTRQKEKERKRGFLITRCRVASHQDLPERVQTPVFWPHEHCSRKIAEVLALPERDRCIWPGDSSRALMIPWMLTP